MVKTEPPLDLRPVVRTRCPKCREWNEGRAGGLGGCRGCGQMLPFMSPGKKLKAPVEKPESERVKKFREEAAKMTAFLWEGENVEAQ